MGSLAAPRTQVTVTRIPLGAAILTLPVRAECEALMIDKAPLTVSSAVCFDFAVPNELGSALFEAVWLSAEAYDAQ